MRLLRLPLLALIGAAALAIAVTGQASATILGGTPAPSCVVSVLPGDAPTPAAPQAPKCFDDLASAVAFATGDLVHIAPTVNTVTQDQLDGGRRAAHARGEDTSSSSIIIGIEYKDSGYSGASRVYNVNATPCSGGGNYSEPDLRGDSFDDSISSARAYAGCQSTHYQYANYTGSLHACTCSSMGYMDDRTTSIYWN
jgi:hypothetical protein